MPRTSWIALLGVFFAWSQWVAAADPLSPPSGCPCQAKCCAGPPYSFSPGCCEAHRHCCDNAWDGYCQERAYWDAIWYKVGTRPSCSCANFSDPLQIPCRHGRYKSY